MADTSFTLEVQSITIHKFGSVVGISDPKNITPDKKSSLDITPQVVQVNLYENLFMPVMRAELSVVDLIGLFVNFPISGEEIIIIRYKTVRDDVSEESVLFFIIDSITDINIGDDNRSMSYIINCVALEAYANARQNVMKAYKDKNLVEISHNIFKDYITSPLKRILPGYTPKEWRADMNEMEPMTFVVPNMSPFFAINALSELAVSEKQGEHTYLFYQTMHGFNFRTLQGLFGDNRTLEDAKKNTYRYLAEESNEQYSTLKNEGRVITNFRINRRHATFQKVAAGYIQNRLFEVNIPQKAIWTSEQTYGDDDNVNLKFIEKNLLNTQEFIELTRVEDTEGEDFANRVKYFVTTQKEHSTQMPIDRFRIRWGRDAIARAAMSQIDMSIVIPGTSRFNAGSMINVEIARMDGFTNQDEELDPFLSGLFLITEVKHMIASGGIHSTVLRINKDSYAESIERESKYAT